MRANFVPVSAAFDETLTVLRVQNHVQNPCGFLSAKSALAATRVCRAMNVIRRK
jgi:hypothetical protein